MASVELGPAAAGGGAGGARGETAANCFGIKLRRRQLRSPTHQPGLISQIIYLREEIHAQGRLAMGID